MGINQKLWEGPRRSDVGRAGLVMALKATRPELPRGHAK